MTESLLDVDGLKVAYPTRHRASKAWINEAQPLGLESKWAVDQVSFGLQPGERLGLVGESGCGKSTLGRAVMRLLPSGSATEGRILFQGRSVLEFTPTELRHFRGESIALIFQDPMTRLDPLMTIGEHCIETLRAHQPQLSRRQAKARSLETLNAVNIPTSRWAQYPHEFSGGMRQRVAIALALLLDPKLIIADEPTTSLDVTVSAQILQMLTQLCAQRMMALLLISHDLAMVGEYCDRIAVMHQGQFVETGAARSVLSQPQHRYTQTLLQAALHVQTLDQLEEWKREGGEQPANLAAEPGTAPLLRLQHLKKHYDLESNWLARFFTGNGSTIKAVDDVTLDIFAGETLGLVGESGCGKSTLSRTILRLVHPAAGRVEFLGRDLAQLSRSALQQQRRHIQMVFQDPRACLNPRMTIGESIADPLWVHGLASAAEVRQQVRHLLERVNLTPVEDYEQRYPGELSGGQQQRVAIARALITRPQLLICDEPVSMLDATVQAQVLDLMRELKRDFNLTYLFITHDLWVARYFCDRIAVMKSGQIVELGETQTVFTHPQHPYTQTLLQSAPLLAH